MYEALAAGASGFLLKDATFPELLHAVRVVAAGDALLSPEITRRVVAEFTRQRAAAQAVILAYELGPVRPSAPR